MVMAVQHITVSIDKPVAQVYEFAANPENMPKWAAGLSSTKLQKSGEVWVADSPMGQVKIRFAPKNSFGVIDHDVTLPSGEVNHNPLRVQANGTGSEVVFSLYRQPRMSDADYKKDAAAVEKDLQRLKTLLDQKEAKTK